MMESMYIQMTELLLNFSKNQILIKEGDHNDEVYEEIFPRIYRRTITRITLGIPFAIRILRDLMHPSKTNCILCPEKRSISYRLHIGIIFQGIKCSR